MIGHVETSLKNSCIGILGIFKRPVIRCVPDVESLYKNKQQLLCNSDNKILYRRKGGSEFHLVLSGKGTKREILQYFRRYDMVEQLPNMRRLLKSLDDS